MPICMTKRIAVTGATGQIAYSLLFRLANGDLFGPEESICLNLYDIPETQAALEGVMMELEDCAFPLLHEMLSDSDPVEMFRDVDCAFLIGARPRGPGMERSELLSKNAEIFQIEGKALNASAPPHVKVLVVGNPCNTNCLIAMKNAPRILKENFHAMLQLDQSRAAAQLAKKAGVFSKEVNHMTIWGNHSTTQVPDFVNARIGQRGVLEVIKDREWLEGDFLNGVQKRGAAVIAARGKSSAASAAQAAIESMRALYTPTEWFTSGVCSDDNPYGIEENLIFGFPCRSTGEGEYEIISNVPWDDFLKEKIALTQKELIEERSCVEEMLI